MSRIKKEIFIEAPVERVWEHISDPMKIAGWLMPNDFEARVGKAFSMDCAEQGKIACVVKEVVVPRKLVYTFQSQTTRVETVVCFTLAEEGGGTRLTLVHEGWDALPPDQSGIADLFGGGWDGYLKGLQAKLEEPVAT